MILALAVCGLYGVDLNKANREHKYSDGKWVCPSYTPPSYYQLIIPGLRRSRRLALSSDGPPLHHPVHVAHPVRLRLGHHPLDPVDLALRTVWEYVY